MGLGLGGGGGGGGGGHTAPAMTRVLRLVILANENRNLRNIYRVTAQRLYRAFSTD